MASSGRMRATADGTVGLFRRLNDNSPNFHAHDTVSDHSQSERFHTLCGEKNTSCIHRCAQATVHGRCLKPPTARWRCSLPRREHQQQFRKESVTLVTAPLTSHSHCFTFQLVRSRAADRAPPLHRQQITSNKRTDTATPHAGRCATSSARVLSAT